MKILYKLIGSFLRKSLPEPTSKELDAAIQLKMDFKQISIARTDSVAPSELEWVNNMQRLQCLVLKNDPRKFLLWDVISKTMFISYEPYIYTELMYLKSSPNWALRWCSAIKEVHVGCPTPYVFYPDSSANLIHHAYHLAQFEEKTNINSQEFELVLEFGGGYGSMCRLFFNLGFRGRYIIFDFDAFSALQKYFLASIGLPVKPICEFNKSDVGIFFVSNVNDLIELLDGQSGVCEALFVATWSISESPKQVRNAILPIVSNFKAFLIAYQDQFGEVDNIDYFKEWRRELSNIIWSEWEINHNMGNSYLVGRK